MRHDFDGGQNLESRSSRGSDYGFYDTNLSDFPQHETPADLCLYGKPGPKCGCGFCAEMVARERDKGSIV